MKVIKIIFYISYIIIRKKLQKKENIYANHFLTNSILSLCCNSKTNICKGLKFSPNINNI